MINYHILVLLCIHSIISLVNMYIISVSNSTQFTFIFLYYTCSRKAFFNVRTYLIPMYLLQFCERMTLTICIDVICIAMKYINLESLKPIFGSVEVQKLPFYLTNFKCSESLFREFMQFLRTEIYQILKLRASKNCKNHRFLTSTIPQN